MKLNRRGALGIAAAALVIAGGGAAFAATSQVAAVPVTAVTHIQNDPDSGNNGTWATDQIDRTLTVTVAADQTGVPLGSVRYLAHVADTGTFETLPGAFTPNQVILGQHIANVVDGTLTGTADYTIVAPSPAEVLNGGPNAGIVSALNDAGHPPAASQSLTDWPVQAFTPQLPAGEITLNHFNYSYTTQAGENWVDADTNSDGDTVAAGNITGIQFVPPTLPRLSRGHAVEINPVREKVFFVLSGTNACVHFIIAGPGKIDGHEGWVPAKVGLNFGYYGGLDAGHTYLVFFTPVESCGSQVQIPGTRTGHVTFVS